MERGINYIVIGGCFIASLVSLVIFIFWFSGSDIFSNTKTYKAYSKSAIEGVKVNSFVKYKGINIGRIQDIRFKDGDFGEVEVVLELRADLPIKKDSTLKVEQSGILGNSFLSLVQNEKSSDFMESSDTTLNIESSAFVGQILESIPDVANKAGDLIENANKILSDENAKNIATTLVLLQDSALVLNGTLKSLQQNSANIDSLLFNTNQTIQNANKAIDLINKKLQNGEYDIKSTLTPTLISLEQSLYNINELAKKGSNLLDKLEENPYNTIFGYRDENDK